ncbi:hypothetical protein GWR56_18585 [Mucilaginibacter sp. 14171R-50]|uniref:hypothetical protein n=1 Tax=Mucilaginibacter sp. 14171R-50 TaxID=2703789 RepID=UPI00138B9CA9|nr:hypothetical protein [Mucilaginibacter sp. 14171R-50]QHS57453.1 hypothetical protein GWR56_18585 [Mucilaginibacter sp. 14171R-50]
MTTSQKDELISELLANRISLPNFISLRAEVDERDLSNIIQRIYDLNDEQVKKIAALAPLMAKVDAIKNQQRNGKFIAKIKNGFRGKPGNKVILVEGDSWFNYPILLSDVIDWIGMESNMAVYSLASGGDWLLNMLSARKYVEQLSTMHPDVFILSGGGNDLVGSNRIAAMVDPSGKMNELSHSEWAQRLMKPGGAPINMDRFENGIAYLSKDFFALLMFFQLQYYNIFNGILTSGSGDAKKGKFPGIKIITQGYDYAQPNRKPGFGIKPWRWYKPFARMFLGHGSWLKTPLDLRGISDENVQRDVVYAMIYLFNEMMIETGELFKNIAGYDCVFHIDSRGSVGDDGWTDELHPLPAKFRNTGRAFINCINGLPPTSGLVYKV